jgi:hypothetical protein
LLYDHMMEVCEEGGLEHRDEEAIGKGTSAHAVEG